MQKIYLDADFRCYVTPSEGLVEIETDAFDGKCDAYIEGYRFVPADKIWVREDGTIFAGEMIAPWKPWAELDAAQREYEREQYNALLSKLSEVYENVDT